MNTDLIDVVVRQPELQGLAVAVLQLEQADGRPLPGFTAGAHVDLHLPGGLVRPYSLCSDPADTRRYRLGVLKDPQSRGGSLALHTALGEGRLREGQRLAISAPRNHFPLVEDAPYSLLVGGGIGITPMLAMAWRLHALGRPFALHYCVRQADQAAFLAELASVPWAARVRVHVDGAADSQRFQPRAELLHGPAGSHLYVCGPSGFMDWVLAEAEAAGLPAAQRHREYFSAPSKPAGEGAERSVELVLQRSGKTVMVAPEQSLLDALKTVGIRVPVSCEQGVCGTCLCTVLDGEPEHRDAYLTDEERAANDQILVCCSRARTARLVLDL